MLFIHMLSISQLLLPTRQNTFTSVNDAQLIFDISQNQIKFHHTFLLPKYLLTHLSPSSAFNSAKKETSLHKASHWLKSHDIRSVVARTLWLGNETSNLIKLIWNVVHQFEDGNLHVIISILFALRSKILLRFSFREVCLRRCCVCGFFSGRKLATKVLILPHGFHRVCPLSVAGRLRFGARFISCLLRQPSRERDWWLTNSTGGPVAKSGEFQPAV